MKGSICLVVFLVTSSLVSRAEVRLPKIFTDHMVIQRDREAPVWGWASPGERIVVKFAGQRVRATADAAGKWTVALKPLQASAKPRKMTITGGNRIVLSDVLVGDVWLASGQSNMAYSMGGLWGSNPPPVPPSADKNAKPIVWPQPAQRIIQDRQSPQCPMVRLNRQMWLQFILPNRPDPVSPGWQHCSTDTLFDFSAVAYYFARNLQDALHVPIGVIESAVGGTRIEVWTPLSAYEKSPVFENDADLVKGLVDGEVAGRLYKPWIEPLAPFALKGAIWYQGESNVLLVDNRYGTKMSLLISSWRNAWHEEDLPFYFVQLAPFAYSESQKSPSATHDLTRETLAEIRQQQMDVLKDQNTGIALTSDLVDDVHDIHPTDKWNVGHRLALLALDKTYRLGNVVSAGPQFKSMDVIGNQAFVSFENADGGLASSDGKPLTDFSIAGNDGKFVPAEAVIQGDRVLVSSSLIEHPTAVRFAWDEVARPNLANRSRLPAVPFKTE
jgi:sialate O-acetylesterase